MKLPNQAKQRGSMLLEGLIAILIFSAGIVALMGLQAVSIRVSADSKYRADAAFLANQIIGQMWVDRTSLASYAHQATGAACSPTGAASANLNVTNWLGSAGTLSTVVDSLPAATAQIIIGANNLVTVTVCWRAPQATAPSNHTVTAQIN
jgi:type IV pilus assembly protein PilV